MLKSPFSIQVSHSTAIKEHAILLGTENCLISMDNTFNNHDSESLLTRRPRDSLLIEP